MAQALDIQLQRSLINTPSTLLYGEPSWTDNTQSFYIGDSSGIPTLINRNFFVFGASRNANINTNQSLRREDSTFISSVPYIIPYPSFIYKATAECENVNNTRTWSLVIEKNGTVILTLIKTSGVSKVVSPNLNLSVTSGDEIVIYFRNASGVINKPSGLLYGKSI